MAALLVKIASAIQLTRLTMAFGAVADVWFIILLTRASDAYTNVPVHDMNLAQALAAGAVVAIGLFAYGASLNDVLDVRHDAAFSPQRPIPAGRIKLGQAVVVTIGALIIAVLGGAALGTWALWITLLTAAGILFYNAAGKYIPAIGLVTIGLVHVTHMLIPNVQLHFTWPVWLVMTHAMAIATAVHVLEEKRPRLTLRGSLGALLGWTFWSALVIGWGAMQTDDGLWPQQAEPWAVLWPVLTALAFLAVAWWKVSGVRGAAAAEKLKRYGAMWQALYGAAWLAALGLSTQALWISGFAIAGFLAMTFIKEITGLSSRPVVYR
ncbi:MAG: UbiA family prenyltransferase [Planctomycetes bacterium]|nr:UbiA family prenyltransferase [Planctomycetota bacterium]